MAATSNKFIPLLALVGLLIVGTVMWKQFSGSGPVKSGEALKECWRRFKSDQACRLNFDQGPAPGFLMPGCG